jgi:endo-beta-N-acetylglucosaminidase D
LTIEGRIDWQDKLSALNKPFFDVTDGIFVNYTWKRPYLDDSVRLAGERRFDVFTGIDFFGRNTFGGGGFNAHKALREILTAQTSIALFAPGWTFEFFGSSKFPLADARLWTDSTLAFDFPWSEPLPTTAPDMCDLGCVLDFVSIANAPGQNHFYTNFDCGFGKAYFLEGERVSDSAWSHLGRQSIASNIFEQSDLFNVSIDHEVYSGGSCLLLYTPPNQEHVYIPLFQTSIQLHGPFSIEMSYYSESHIHKLGIFLMTASEIYFLYSDCQQSKEWMRISFSSHHHKLPKEQISCIGVCVTTDLTVSSEIIQRNEFQKKTQNKLIGCGSHIARIGEIALHETKTPSHFQCDLHFETHPLNDEEYFLDIIFSSTGIRIEKWEIYQDKAWIGTCFCGTFRIRKFKQTVGSQLSRFKGVGYSSTGEILKEVEKSFQFK